MSTPPPVLLASSSPYRRTLLQRILREFDHAAPEIDEASRPDEPAEAAALRLARLKALACAKHRPDALVIGGDQVPALDGQLLHKPGSHARAVEQLLECAGQSVVFHTAVAVTGPVAEPIETYIDRTTVRFRPLGQAEIERYLEKDRPYDCAGSFKAETLGIALFESIETTDPTAIQGLPLIWLADCLRRRGFDLP
jgi:septum formation protein